MWSLAASPGRRKGLLGSPLLLPHPLMYIGLRHMPPPCLDCGCEASAMFVGVSWDLGGFPEAFLRLALVNPTAPEVNESSRRRKRRRSRRWWKRRKGGSRKSRRRRGRSEFSLACFAFFFFRGYVRSERAARLIAKRLRDYKTFCSHATVLTAQTVRDYKTFCSHAKFLTEKRLLD